MGVVALGRPRCPLGGDDLVGAGTRDGVSDRGVSRCEIVPFQAAFIAWGDRKYKASAESAPYWQHVQELEPLASRAMDATGRELIHTMPPQLGGQAVVGLSPYLLAFSTYDGMGHLDQPLRDALVQCIAELRQREEDAPGGGNPPTGWIAASGRWYRPWAM